MPTAMAASTARRANSPGGLAPAASLPETSASRSCRSTRADATSQATRGRHGRFPENILYWDIVGGLPLPNGSADLLYSSHVLEHLSLEDFRAALPNCRHTLHTEGTFRLVVPDLERMIDEYRAETDHDAAIRFVANTGLGQTERPRGAAGFLR
jgi:hypothetical protein